MNQHLLVFTVAITCWYGAALYYSAPDGPVTGVGDEGAGQSAPYQGKKLPDFAQIVDVAEKKRRFFDFLYPFIVDQNRLLTQKRSRLLALRGKPLDDSELRWVSDLAQKYRLSWQVDQTEAADGVEVPREVLDELLVRVDQIPPSLVMAQAANESAWGTSRFARQGNNLFGQWCFSKGCGIVPASRPQGKSHEVRRFKTVAGSVAGYFHNINSQPSYHELRELRSSFRRVGRGHEAGEWLAEGLLSYSSRREEYVREIQAMIRSNRLAEYDRGVLGSSQLARGAGADGAG
ncbi:glucosaminidase domain-containing protein [Aestuariirhabdus sp. LZHN29]|uniref:glucosaminidase domain-containing protein n=1 Tax=Aestuariirhabdus sp. LZHN29 TaxID=3417462 RepID=UPI003CF61AD3